MTNAPPEEPRSLRAEAHDPKRTRRAGLSGRRVGGAAVLLGASVLLSRVIGYGREAVLAREVGAGAAMDAYRAAFQLPDLLNYFLAGGAATIAFIPLYARHLAQHDETRSARLLSVTLGNTLVASAVAVTVLFAAADPLVRWQFGFEGEQHALAVRLTRILLPAQVFFLAGGVLRAALMARGHFLSQAVGPLLYNGGVILGGLLLGAWIGVEGFAWGALAGAGLGLFVFPLLDARRRFGVGVRVAPRDGEFLAYLATAIPLMLGLSLLTVDEWYGRWFGARIDEGVVATLGYARVLMQAPVAVVGQATAVAALPLLTRLASEGRTDELEATLVATLRTALGLAMLGGAGLYALGEPGVAVLYQHGAFTEADGARVVSFLRIMAFAVPAWVIQQITVRAFYARKDPWRPMLLGTAIALGCIPLYLALGRRSGGAGIALAGALGMWVNAAATLALARRVHGGPSLAPIAASGVRALGIALLAVFAARMVATDASDFAGWLVELVRVGAVFGAVALVGILVLGDDSQRETLRFAARLGRRSR